MSQRDRQWRAHALARPPRMWPVYVIYAVYAMALLAVVATVPLARRGARHLLWAGWVTLAIVLPLAATSSAMTLIPSSFWPTWRLGLGYVVVLAAPTGIAALVADRLARLRPMPARGRHMALVACAVVAAAAASVVVSRPLYPTVSLIHAEQ